MNGDLTASEIVTGDLNSIVDSLETELQLLCGKKLLIIGGAGFLGYYLVQAALHYNWRQGSNSAKNINLTVYDNFIRGIPPWLTQLQLQHPFTVDNFDIKNPIPPEHGSFHYIIHAASIASPTYYRRYPIETMDANVTGLRNVLEYALASKTSINPVEGILFYSTSEIYGDPTPENIPTPETYRGNVSCTGPRACYDESKRYGETLCVNFAQQYDIPVKIARPFNNYGPGLKLTDARVLPDFVKDVLSNRNIRVYSDGTPTRTFCYVSDAIVGYYKLLTKGRNGEAYNIGTETPEITMNELADKVVSCARELFGYQGKVVMEKNNDAQYLIDNPNRRCPIIEKAHRELGYSPKIDIDIGLQRSLLWYSENQNQGKIQ